MQTLKLQKGVQTFLAIACCQFSIFHFPFFSFHFNFSSRFAFVSASAAASVSLVLTHTNNLFIKYMFYNCFAACCKCFSACWLTHPAHPTPPPSTCYASHAECRVHRAHTHTHTHCNTLQIHEFSSAVLNFVRRTFWNIFETVFE